MDGHGRAEQSSRVNNKHNKLKHKRSLHNKIQQQQQQTLNNHRYQ